MTVVVIDTGIDLDHPFFGSDANADGMSDRIVFQYDFADGDADATDVRGHGSHVTSIVASSDPNHLGIAPGVDIIHLKVFSDDGRGQFSDAEQALQWVVDHAQTYNVAAVNLSFGDRGNWDYAAGRFGIGDELDALAAMDVIVVASAGNSFATEGSRTGVAYPAADPNTIAVGAVWDSDSGGPWNFGGYGTDYSTGPDRITVFSQRHGELIDVFAPGAIITGADAVGGVMAMSGTSQAAPYVTGAAILVQQIALETIGRTITPHEFRTLLRVTGRTIVDGDDENDSVINTGLSYHRLDVLALAEAITTLDADNPDHGPNETDDSLDGDGHGKDNGGQIQPHAHPFAHTITLVSGELRDGVDFGNNLANVAPVLAAIADKTVEELATLTFTVSATDSDLPANTLTYSATGLPEGATFDAATRQFSWTPGEVQGPSSYDMTFTVSDGTLTDEETITITVDEVNVAPLLGAIGSKSVDESTALTFSVLATDSDLPANTLTYSATGLPAGAMFDGATRSFSWTPNETQGPGSYDVTIEVTDGALSDAETVTITVAEVNVAPVLGAIGDRSVDEQATLSFTVTATDQDLPAQTLSFSLVGAPAGASMTSGGVFTWTPTEAQGPGSYPFDVVVSDGALTDSETITVTVNEVNVAPVLSGHWQ